MKHFGKQLSKKVVAFGISLALLLVFQLPAQNVHADNINMDRMSSAAAATATACTDSGSCSAQAHFSCPCNSSTATNLPDEQRLSEREQEDEPTPPGTTLYYAQWQAFAVSNKLAGAHNGSAAPLRPPDLVKLYANFRF